MTLEGSASLGTVASITFEWQSPQNVEPRSYKCGYCDRVVGPNLGYWAAVRRSDGQPHAPLVVMICSHCKKPTFFDFDGVQHPGVAYGNAVDALPQDIAGLYGEARRAYAAGAHTAAVLACRKILMNIAVAKGAKPGEPFVVYVEYLADSGYVPPDGRGWVDHIRSKGNEATHEIALMTATDAEELISFAEMLLKFVFEFPSKVPAKP